MKDLTLTIPADSPKNDNLELIKALPKDLTRLNVGWKFQELSNRRGEMSFDEECLKALPKNLHHLDGAFPMFTGFISLLPRTIRSLMLLGHIADGALPEQVFHDFPPLLEIFASPFIDRIKEDSFLRVVKEFPKSLTKFVLPGFMTDEMLAQMPESINFIGAYGSVGLTEELVQYLPSSLRTLSLPRSFPVRDNKAWFMRFPPSVTSIISRDLGTQYIQHRRELLRELIRH
jgi:hypothetical protein